MRLAFYADFIVRNSPPSTEDFCLQKWGFLHCKKQISGAAGLSLDDAVKITVYLKDYASKPDFERIYRKYFSEPPPARIVVQSSFIDFDVEIDAILQERHKVCP